MKYLKSNCAKGFAFSVLYVTSGLLFFSLTEAMGIHSTPLHLLFIPPGLVVVLAAFGGIFAFFFGVFLEIVIFGLIAWGILSIYYHFNKKNETKRE
jgi:hypothetical protein